MQLCGPGDLCTGDALEVPSLTGPPLTSRPSPEPRSAVFPVRPRSSPITLATCWALDGTYGTWGQTAGRGGGRFHSTPGLPSKGEPTGGGLGGTCRCSGTRRKPGMSTAAHTA